MDITVCQSKYNARLTLKKPLDGLSDSTVPSSRDGSKLRCRAQNSRGKRVPLRLITLEYRREHPFHEDVFYIK